MKPLHLIIIFLFLSCSKSNQTKNSERPSVSTSSDSTDYLCTLKTMQKVYKLGETPELEVEIKNVSNTEVYFIGALDGSEFKDRMPYCYFTVEKPKIDTVDMWGICGNINPLRPEDFVLTKPNESFNPYVDVDYGPIQSSKIRDQENFKNKGKYKIQFHYSTKSDSVESFLGGVIGIEKDTTEIDTLRVLFERVPKIELSSNVVEIEFK